MSIHTPLPPAVQVIQLPVSPWRISTAAVTSSICHYWLAYTISWSPSFQLHQWGAGPLRPVPVPTGRARLHAPGESRACCVHVASMQWRRATPSLPAMSSGMTEPRSIYSYMVQACLLLGILAGPDSRGLMLKSLDVYAWLQRRPRCSHIP